MPRSSSLFVVLLAGRTAAAIRVPFLSGRERTREQLKSGIASFYDASSGIWEET